MRLLATMCSTALSLTLAACGGSDSEPAKPAGSQAAPSEASGPVATTAPTLAVQSGTPTAASSGAREKVDCGTAPGFVALPADAVIDGCFLSQARPGFGNGALIFSTKLGADAVIAFYRGKAHAAGMADSPVAGAAGTYSAQIGKKRTIKVITRPGDDGGADVTLNWSEDDKED